MFFKFNFLERVKEMEIKPADKCKYDILSLGEEAPMHVGKYEALVVPPTSANPGVGVEERVNGRSGSLFR